MLQTFTRIQLDDLSESMQLLCSLNRSCLNRETALVLQERVQNLLVLDTIACILLIFISALSCVHDFSNTFPPKYWVIIHTTILAINYLFPLKLKLIQREKDASQIEKKNKVIKLHSVLKKHMPAVRLENHDVS